MEITAGASRSTFSDKRLERRVPIDILLNKYVDGEPHTCRAVNLSHGGMLLYRIFEPVFSAEVASKPVSIEFQLPGNPHVLRMDGVVLSEYPAARAHGVRFTHVSAEDRDLIDRYLAADRVDIALAQIGT